MRNMIVITLLLVSAGTISAQERPLATRGVPTDERCGAQVALAAPASALKIAGGAEPSKQLFSPGDAVMITGGSAQGVRAGQRYVVRRIVEDRFAHPTLGEKPRSVHTAGWITVVETQSDISIAKITEACDGINTGDYLEPLAVPTASADLVGGEPDYARPARLILGDERRQAGGAGSLLVMDRGTDHGVRAGQRLTVFRQTLDGKGPVAKVGDAVIVTTHPETSLIRIIASNDAVYVGDLIAIHR
ncbi:MAG: hypothetical protein ABIS06_20625 [Vicinamibacterales bacterium]